MAGNGFGRGLIEADLQRRLLELPHELAQWNASIGANANGSGIHMSQITAVRTMMAGLTSRQDQDFEALKKQPDVSAFADAYYALLNDLAGSHDLWRIFRIVLDQRNDPYLKPLADTSDLIAWDCYHTGLEQAWKWGVLPKDQFRPPPLTFLESSLTPATASRGESVETLGFPVRQYRDLMLPMPIVLYPIDQASSLWLMSSLAHEAGHNLDHDLDPRPGRRLTDEYRKLLIGRVPNDREPQWRRWMNEIFADAIAVVLCGSGFAVSMTGWTLALGPGAAFRSFDNRAVHPPLFLRLRVLSQMLVTIGQPFQQKGEELIALCDQQNRPAWEAPYEGDATTMAKLLLAEPVDPLGKRTLTDLNDDLATDENRIAQLAVHFLDGSKQRPDPAQPSPMPFRTVCAAAAIAAASINKPTPAALDDLQQKAQNYLSFIPRPNMLAGEAVNPQFLEALTARLRFGTLRQNQEN